ncbi:MAG: ABC transporter permease [Oscillospiraceae bacterium]
MKASMIFSLAKNDFKAKYAGSAFGSFWAFLSPLVTVLIYWFVFQVAMKSNKIGDAPYILWLISGIAPWFFFSEALMAATTSMRDYSFLVKKTKFSYEYLPCIRIISALFVHVFFVALVYIISVVFGYSPKFSNIQFAYYMACLCALTYVLGQILAILNVYFKDVASVVNVLIQLGFWITPIFWDINNLSGRVKTMFAANPLFYIVRGYRDAFIYGKNPIDYPLDGICFWCIIILLFCIGNKLLKSAKSEIPDLV